MFISPYEVRISRNDGNSTLVLKLKEMINEMKKSLAKKDEEILILKKTSQNVKLIEVQIANETLFSELSRLKSLLPTNANSSTQPSIQELESRIRFLDDKCSGLESSLEQREKEIFRLKSHLESKSHQFFKERKKSVRMESMLKQTEEKVKNMEDSSLPKAFRIISPQEHIKNIVSQKNQALSLLDSRVKDLSQKLEMEKESSEREIARLQKVIQAKNTEISKMEEKLKVLISGRTSESQISRSLSNAQNSSPLKVNKSKRISNEVGVLRPIVKYSDVKIMAFELRLKLIEKKIEHEKLFVFLLPNQFIINDSISLGKMKEILEEFPFEIEDNDKCEIFARFLIEDNNLPHVRYSNNTLSDIKIVGSIFKRLIPHYNLEDFAYKEKNEREIKEFLKPHKTFLLFAFRDLGLNDGKCDYETLTKVLKDKPVEMNNLQILKSLFFLFSESNNLENLNWSKLINY